MLQINVFSSIADVPKDAWNGLLKGHSSTYSHAFWEIIEKSRLNDFSYRYVLFYNETDTPVALASFYSITTDIAIFAPAGLRGILAIIRRIFPNFLKLRMLECGTPITLNSPPFVTNGDVALDEVIVALDQLLTETAKAEGQLLVVVRDFEPAAQILERDFLRLGYCLVKSLPNTYMDISWSTASDYLASVKSYYRCKILKHRRRVEAQNIRYELVEDFAAMADQLCAQWLVVHTNADEFQREVLTPEFYREFATKMGSHSKVLLFYQHDTLIGHALLLMDGELLRWLYFGRTEAINDSLYIYAGHKVIETAIMLGAKRLELGLTTYAIKQDLGAQVASIQLAIKSPLHILNPLVKFIYPLMNHIPVIANKSVFKEEKTNARQQNGAQKP